MFPATHAQYNLFQRWFLGETETKTDKSSQSARSTSSLLKTSENTPDIAVFK